MSIYILVASDDSDALKALQEFFEEGDRYASAPTDEYEVDYVSLKEVVPVIEGPTADYFDLTIVVGEAVDETVSLLVSLAGKAGLPCLFLSELPDDLEGLLAMIEATFEAVELFAEEETEESSSHISHGVGIAVGHVGATRGCLQPREAPDG